MEPGQEELRKGIDGCTEGERLGGEGAVGDLNIGRQLEVKGEIFIRNMSLV